VRLVCFAVRAELIQLKTSFDRLLVLRRLVVDLLTGSAGQLDQVVLGHTFGWEEDTQKTSFWQVSAIEAGIQGGKLSFIEVSMMAYFA
jgi:hypothetical protein